MPPYYYMTLGNQLVTDPSNAAPGSITGAVNTSTGQQFGTLGDFAQLPAQFQNNAYQETILGLQGAQLNEAMRQNDLAQGRYDDWQNSWQQQYLSPALKGIQGLGTLAGIFMGFQQLGLMKDQLGLAKEQWATTKEEINRIKSVRNKLNQQYMGG